MDLTYQGDEGCGRVFSANAAESEPAAAAAFAATPAATAAWIQLPRLLRRRFLLRRLARFRLPRPLQTSTNGWWSLSRLFSVASSTNFFPPRLRIPFAGIVFGLGVSVDVLTGDEVARANVEDTHHIARALVVDAHHKELISMGLHCGFRGIEVHLGGTKRLQIIDFESRAVP